MACGVFGIELEEALQSKEAHWSAIDESASALEAD